MAKALKCDLCGTLEEGEPIARVNVPGVNTNEDWCTDCFASCTCRSPVLIRRERRRPGSTGIDRPANAGPLPVNDAEAVIREHADHVRKHMVFEFLRRFDMLVELAVQRSGPGSPGEREHGDASFHKSKRELRWDRFEEYADAIFYACLERERRNRE